MIREEYLNPEFMYKLINSLCKKDGWIMSDFTFGKLTYKNFKQPILMQNNHGYNIVYKFTVYKVPDVNFGRRTSWQGRRLTSVSGPNLMKNLIYKNIYFDISNECFVEHDDTISEFEEFPSFFKLDNQLYYGIYDQPKILKYHYSYARDCSSISNYMCTMNINLRNLFDPFSILYNMTDEKNKIEQSFMDEGWEICFESQEEANATIKAILMGNKSYNCAEFYKVLDDSCGKMFHGENNYFNLHIHNPKFPVFYTDNVLELTTPIAEAVIGLGNSVNRSLNKIHETLILLSHSVTRLIECNMDKLFDDEWYVSQFHGLNLIEIGRTERSLEIIQNKLLVDHNFGSKHDICLNAVSEANSHIQESYASLYSSIKKLKTSNLSLNTLLEISNGFKKLENKQEQIHR